MKDAYYFPHDTNATQDPKIMELISCWGMAGLGIYWIIIELLHQHENGKISEGELDSCLRFYDKFENNNHEEKESLTSVKQVLTSVKLLSVDNGYYFSDRVLRNKELRKEVSKKRSDAGKLSAIARRNTNEESTSVEQVLASVEQNSTKERKGKERKLKESKEIKLPEDKTRAAFAPPTVQEVTNYCRERGGIVNPIKWLSHYEANGWKVGKNPMKDWKAAVRTWEHSEYNQNVPQAPKRPIIEPSNAYRPTDNAAYLRSEAWHKAFYKDGCPGCGHKPKTDLDICNCETYKKSLEKAIESFKS